MNLSLFHLVREPNIIAAKNPVLVLLHGYGSNEEDLFSFAPQLPPEYFVISVRAPYSLPPYGNAWYAIDFDADMNKFSNNEQAAESRDSIVKFIADLPKHYPIDSADVTLIGFSQGCILSYAVALSYPQIVRRVGAMSGYLNEELLVEGYANNDFSRLDISISHGSQDQVIPVEWARRAKPILEGLGISSRYKEYPVGPGVAPQNFYDLLDWLRETKR